VPRVWLLPFRCFLKEYVPDPRTHTHTFTLPRTRTRTPPMSCFREELYEVPLQALMSGQTAEITELQVEAYLERHRVDALMEDLLASVIQNMPTCVVTSLH
jgi:hypothetical protein